MAEAPARHAMVRVDPAVWRTLVAGRSDLVGLPLVAAWAERGWPLVVRRPTGEDTGIPLGIPLGLPLGLPLPPAEGRRRLSFTVAPSALRAVEPPPRLAEAAPAAPAAWQPTLRRLVALDPETRTFGSLAWQHLTGLAYLAPSSDIDLLWRLDGSAGTLLSGLSAIARDAPMRIDGECLGAAGTAAQWQELAAGTPEILVKNAAGVAVVARADFLAGAGC